MATSQVLKCHFWVQLASQAGCSLLGDTQVLFPFPTQDGVRGRSLVPTQLKEALDSLSLPLNFPPPRSEPLNFSDPVETRAGLLGFSHIARWCWSTLAKGITREELLLVACCSHVCLL